MTTSNMDELLSIRRVTHGDFKVTASVAQQIKDICRCTGNSLCAPQREALDAIATKIARIVSGDANCKDHWHDIAGYATLGKEACK
jgi:hypothetical protein